MQVRLHGCAVAIFLVFIVAATIACQPSVDAQGIKTEQADADAQHHVYTNKLVKIEDPQPLLADYPEFVQPVKDLVHYEAPPLVVDEDADLDVRAWRWSYNARGIVEIPNRLKAYDTALIVVHPWGIDDGQGWRTPEPAGAADFCTPAKNAFSHEHVRQVLNPLLQRLRPKMGLVLHSEPGG